MLTKQVYLADPCRASSLPYWKACRIVPPPGIVLIHEEDFTPANYPDCQDEPYFRLRHNLKAVPAPQLPEGFSPCALSLSEYASHISRCYEDIGVTESELRQFTDRTVYDATLWIAAKDSRTGAVAATGIADLDREIREGILEWIQVSPEYRGCGLGRWLVCELLRRMQGRADFATVSGRCGNPTNPEQLYRVCGFTGRDVWHILTPV